MAASRLPRVGRERGSLPPALLPHPTPNCLGTRLRGGGTSPDVRGFSATFPASLPQWMARHRGRQGRARPTPPHPPQVSSRRRSWSRAEVRGPDSGHCEKVAEPHPATVSLEPLEDKPVGWSNMIHVCVSLPTDPDHREKQGGRPLGCTTSCGAGRVPWTPWLLQHCFYCKNKCVITILPCPLPVSRLCQAQQPCRGGRGWQPRGQGPSQPWASPHGCPRLSHVPRAQGCPPPSSCICSANCRPMASRGLALYPKFI